MRFSLSSLVRLLGLFGLVFTLAAIGLGRTVPKGSGHRSESPPRYVGVNGAMFEPPISESYLLDTQSGSLSRISPVDGILIEFAGCSPWRDDRGGFEIVGRATEIQGVDTGKSPVGSGLARLTQAGPPTIDLTATYPAITGRPCWTPGSTSRVIYPAGDGALYTREFADLAGADESTEPRQVVWACPAPGGGGTRIEDPVAPVFAGLGGRLLVAFSSVPKGGSQGKFGNSEIWWLKLDPDGHAIVSAGRMVAPGSPAERARVPNVCLAAYGQVVLTYLSNVDGEPGWHLKIARVDLDPRAGDPVVAPASVRELGEDFSMNLPSFSADGRWVYAVPRAQTRVKVSRRYPVLASLAAQGDAR